MFENYRGKVGAVDFIETNTARFVATGVPDLFIQHFGPADFVEAVGTRGRPVYVKQMRKKWDKGIDFHSQSNPLMICTRPASLVKGSRDT